MAFGQGFSTLFSHCHSRRADKIHSIHCSQSYLVTMHKDLHNSSTSVPDNKDNMNAWNR